MTTSNHLSFSFIGLTVKTYMLIATIWSRAYEFHKSLQAKAPVAKAPQMAASR